MSGPTALQVVLTRELAGTERQVAELAGALRERGWRSLIAARNDLTADAQQAFASAGQLVLLPSRSSRSLAPAVASLIRRERVNIVNGHLGNGSLAAIGGGALTRVPVVSTMHFVEPRHVAGRAAWAKRPLYRLMLRRMSAVIAVSDAVRTLTLEACGPGGPPVYVVHNGVRDIPAEHTSRPEGRVVLYAGRLSAEKGVASLIEALALLPSDVRLWIAGTGLEESRLRGLANQRMAGRVEFLGFVCNIDAVMRRATVLAVPSLHEGFGMVALEGMRAGRPVVGFAVGALPEVIEHGVTGLLVHSGDVAGLSKALQDVLDDARLAGRLGRAGRARFANLFTAGRMAEQTERVYAAALRHQRQAVSA